jgi:hypothetical protein
VLVSTPQWAIDKVKYCRDFDLWAAESRALTERHNAERAVFDARLHELVGRSSAIHDAQSKWENQRQDAIAAATNEIEDWMIMSI